MEATRRTPVRTITCSHRLSKAREARMAESALRDRDIRSQVSGVSAHNSDLLGPRAKFVNALATSLSIVAYLILSQVRTWAIHDEYPLENLHRNFWTGATSNLATFLQIHPRRLQSEVGSKSAEQGGCSRVLKHRRPIRNIRYITSFSIRSSTQHRYRSHVANISWLMP